MDFSQLIEELGGSEATELSLKGKRFWESAQSDNYASGFTAYPIWVEVPQAILDLKGKQHCGGLILRFQKVRQCSF